MDARHKAQQESELANQQLQQAHKLESIGQLAAGIAHEINTPMQYIGDNFRYVQNSFDRIAQSIKPDPDSDDPAQKKFARMISQIPDALAESLVGVQKVTEIVHAMKIFSRVSPKEKELANLRQSIESTLAVSQAE